MYIRMIFLFVCLQSRDEIEAEKKTLAENLTQMSHQTDELRSELEKEKSTVQAFEQELKKVVDCSQEHERKKDDYRHQLETVNNNLQTWKMESDRLKQIQIKKDKEYKDEKTNLENTILSLKSELEQVNLKLTEARDQIQMFETDKIDMQRRLTCSESNCTKQTKQNEELQQQLREKRFKINQMEHSLQSKETKMESLRQDLQKAQQQVFQYIKKKNI
ncbi:BRCT domain protein [Reticulomyxa filosa]|uniref:BRCT domain protein n=1 Tax=Reticulomyxa filosa TaxID=46433 RepID=X6N111_RETFI|nr:BRCT domain protein [Reticulomyxa filosa]|eukprot:ETO19603.1 BRCT domain protein [Reticulomyxa filosa]